jgi:hypothetical protein
MRRHGESYRCQDLSDEEILAAFAAQPSRWETALRLELPVFGSEMFLLDGTQAACFQNQHEDLIKRLGDADRATVLHELAEWRIGLDVVPVPLRLVENCSQFLRPETLDRHMVQLQSSNT